VSENNCFLQIFWCNHVKPWINILHEPYVMVNSGEMKQT